MTEKRKAGRPPAGANKVVDRYTLWMNPGLLKRFESERSIQVAAKGGGKVFANALLCELLSEALAARTLAREAEDMASLMESLANCPDVGVIEIPDDPAAGVSHEATPAPADTPSPTPEPIASSGQTGLGG